VEYLRIFTEILGIRDLLSDKKRLWLETLVYCLEVTKLTKITDPRMIDHIRGNLDKFQKPVSDEIQTPNITQGSCVLKGQCEREIEPHMGSRVRFSMRSTKVAEVGRLTDRVASARLDERKRTKLMVLAPDGARGMYLVPPLTVDWLHPGYMDTVTQSIIFPARLNGRAWDVG